MAIRRAGWRRRGHDPSFRSRGQMMRFGGAAGIAAALCLRDGVQPRHLNVPKLQQILVDEGFHLGDEARLRELGLRPASRA
ncbi:MAG TPA: FAD-dependent oxidoreductase [Candidatus Brocadiia bacterium]|nr:FAD-dependent oxidoreductase [Candidatus Brocadiia bacterium]